MDTTTDIINESLTELLQKGRAVQKAFLMGCEKTENINLQVYFYRKAADREEFNNELMVKMQRIYQDYDLNFIVNRGVNKNWTDVKAFLSAKNEINMFEEAINIDRVTLTEYDVLLVGGNLSVGIRFLLEEHKEALQIDLDKYKTLEDLG